MAAVAGLVVGAVLTGCGGSKAPAPAAAPAPSSSAPSTAPAGPQEFTAEMRRLGHFGDRNFQVATDEQLLGVGNQMCRLWTTSDNASYGGVVSVLRMLPGPPTDAQVETFVRSAVTNLCPQEKALLP